MTKFLLVKLMNDMPWTFCEVKDVILTLCSDYTFLSDENDILRRRIDSH